MKAPDATIDDLSVNNGNAPHAIGRYLTTPEIGHTIDQALNPKTTLRSAGDHQPSAGLGLNEPTTGRVRSTPAYTWQFTAHNHGRLNPPATWRPRKNRQSVPVL